MGFRIIVEVGDNGQIAKIGAESSGGPLPAPVVEHVLRGAYEQVHAQMLVGLVLRALEGAPRVTLAGPAGIPRAGNGLVGAAGEAGP